MPNDAKLGLVVGVGLVITVAVVFFRKEPAGGPVPAAVGAPAVSSFQQPTTASTVARTETRPNPE